MGNWDETTDLLVVGSGAAGLTAALVAAIEGLKVVVCEKDSKIGGTSAISGGAIWIAASERAARARYLDSIAAARRYLENELGAHRRVDLLEAFLESGPAMLSYLEARSEVVFDAVPLPDYHDDAEGGVTAGRVLLARPYDGRQLGPELARIKEPLTALTALGGMMLSPLEVSWMLRPFGSWTAFRHVARRVIRHAADRLRYRRGTHLMNGNALIARFVTSLSAVGVAIRTCAPLEQLVTAHGAVTGVIIRNSHGATRIRARRGVVLATGGAAAKSDLRDDIMADFPHDYTVVPKANTGDGVRAGLAAGGHVDRNVATPAIWTPASVHRAAGSCLTVFPYGYLDRGKPGAIAVNAAGKRFVNEANSYHDVVQAMYRCTAKGVVPRAHLVCDARFLSRYGLGLVRPNDRRLRRFLRDGYIIRAATIPELARAIGAPETALAATIARHNGFAQLGIDCDFGKGRTAYNRSNGDPAVKPNPNLAPIVEAPFYALAMTPATLGPSIGLDVNADAQVLDHARMPIPGLYACGNDTSSVMRGCCPGGGVTIGPAMVTGYRAACHARASRPYI